MNPKREPTTSPRLYDLTLKAGPEMLAIAPRRRKLLSDLGGLVLEIGAGTGLSLVHYPPSTRVIATEPDEASMVRLSERAREAKAHVTVVRADAMHLPFADETFDAVSCHLALCTIPDPARALAEIRRVLKAGGDARLLEHVRAGGPVRAGLQDLLAPLWKRVAAGCRLNQDTEDIVRASGLRVAHVEGRAGVLLPMKLIWARKAE
jgi:ubiquinone/menaquinone biosynthesis C-methylase UbiE